MNTLPNLKLTHFWIHPPEILHFYGTILRTLDKPINLNLNVLDYWLLSPACGRRPWSGDYKMLSVRPCVRTSVRSSRLCINLNISFIYEHIFTKFAGNVYGYENLSVTIFSLILKNKMAAIANCLKIVKVL